MTEPTPTPLCPHCGQSIASEICAYTASFARSGGLARSEALTPEQRQKIARKGGKSVSKAVRSKAATASWARRKAAQHELHPGTVEAVRANVEGAK